MEMKPKLEVSIRSHNNCPASVLEVALGPREAFVATSLSPSTDCHKAEF